MSSQTTDKNLQFTFSHGFTDHDNSYFGYKEKYTSSIALLFLFLLCYTMHYIVSTEQKGTMNISTLVKLVIDK